MIVVLYKYATISTELLLLVLFFVSFQFEMVSTVTVSNVHAVASLILGRAPGIRVHYENRRFRSLFGVSATTCANAYNLLSESVPRGGNLKHFLWSLLFLKIYGTEDVCCTIVRTTRKTFRKWIWIFIPLLANLDMVCIEIGQLQLN